MNVWEKIAQAVDYDYAVKLRAALVAGGNIETARKYGNAETQAGAAAELERACEAVRLRHDEFLRDREAAGEVGFSVVRHESI
jgi:hypothetical protein